MHHLIMKYHLLPGDRIVEPKSNLRIIQHHSIYLGQDDYGTDWIIENKVGHGVRLVTANDYFKDVIEINRIERFSGNGHERRLAVQKALREIGRPYHLINFNCQHFANYVQHNEFKSEQVTGAVAFGLALLLIAAIFSGE